MDRSAPPAATRPPRYKAAVVVFAIIFPLVHFIPPLVARFAGGPRVVQEAVSVAVIVMLMTYVFMPAATRLLHRWLHQA